MVHLTRYDPPAPGRSRGLVLLLHGGKQCSDLPVDGRSASWRRTMAMARALRPALHEQGVAAWVLRFGQRGWNDGAPVADARAALEEVRREAGSVPVVLLGHSMGARTAVRVADDPLVAGVVALAPWLAPGDPVQPLRGKRLVAAHGSSDHITSARLTRAYVDRASTVADTEFVDMGPVGHYMLRRIPAWNDLALTRSLALL